MVTSIAGYSEGSFTKAESKQTERPDALRLLVKPIKPASESQTIRSSRCVASLENASIHSIELSGIKPEFPEVVQTWWNKVCDNLAQQPTPVTERLKQEFQTRLGIQVNDWLNGPAPVDWNQKMPSVDQATDFINKMAVDITSWNPDTKQLETNFYKRNSGYIGFSTTKILSDHIKETVTEELTEKISLEMMALGVLPEECDSVGGCIQEQAPDNRFWVCVPAGLKEKQGHSGNRLSFPTGRCEIHSNSRASSPTSYRDKARQLLKFAIEQTYQQSGLLMEPSHFITTIRGSSTNTAYFIGSRSGGDPGLSDAKTELVKLLPLASVQREFDEQNENFCLSNSLIPWIERVLIQEGKIDSPKSQELGVKIATPDRIAALDLQKIKTFVFDFDETIAPAHTILSDENCQSIVHLLQSETKVIVVTYQPLFTDKLNEIQTAIGSKYKGLRHYFIDPIVRYCQSNKINTDCLSYLLVAPDGGAHLFNLEASGEVSPKKIFSLTVADRLSHALCTALSDVATREGYELLKRGESLVFCFDGEKSPEQIETFYKKSLRPQLAKFGLEKLFVLPCPKLSAQTGRIYLFPNHLDKDRFAQFATRLGQADTLAFFGDRMSKPDSADRKMSLPGSHKFQVDDWKSLQAGLANLTKALFTYR